MATSVRLTIKSMYKNLTPKEKAIADYILEDPKKVYRSSISDTARNLGIADSTFFQFTKKLGFSGFKDFKLALMANENDIDTITTIHENIQQDDDELEMAKKIFDSNISTLVDTKKILDKKKLKTAVDFIDQANKLFLFGIGGSEIVAADAYHKFLRSPVTVVRSADYHIQLMEAAMMTENDCALLISHSGRTKETIQVAKVAKRNGSPVIVITSQSQSPLAKLADVVLISFSEETTFRSEALASRISQLSLLDAIFTILMFRNQEKSQISITKVREVINEVKD